MKKLDHDKRGKQKEIDPTISIQILLGRGGSWIMKFS